MCYEIVQKAKTLRHEAIFCDKFTSIALITPIDSFNFKQEYKKSQGGYFELNMQSKYLFIFKTVFHSSEKENETSKEILKSLREQAIAYSCAGNNEEDELEILANLID